MDQFLTSLFQVYMVGYLACVFSWIFGTESRELIRSGMVKPSTIMIKSIWWFWILYITLKDIDE